MDLVDYDQGVFARIAGEYATLARELGIERVHALPLSARDGDWVTQPSTAMAWYRGPTLLQALEEAEPARADSGGGMRLPVQWVNRPNADFRGYAGTLAAGEVHPGMPVVVLPSGRRSRVLRVLGPDGEVERAVRGLAVTLTLADEIDISRGDVIAQAAHPPEVADQFAAHLLWMAEQPLLPGRQYWLKLGAREVLAEVTEIKHKVDVNTQEHLAARRLALNEVGFCNLALTAPVAFERYADNRALGGFILVDRHTNATVGCGTLSFALRRASNIHWHALAVDRAARGRIKGQVPRCLWFTGLSGSGKSTIATLVDRKLHADGYHAYMLDGDNVRHGLNKDLGFTPEDRVENIRRVAEVARLMVDAGLIVVVSFISPYRSEREMARSLFAPGEFVEVYVDTPLEVCEQRDTKGLYARARAGQLPNFTGIDAPYEAPEAPELRLDTSADTPEELAARVVAAAVG